MEQIDFFEMGFQALGGLGLFFLGLRYLSESLQRLAGELIRKIIAFATANRVIAVLAGMVVTMIVQSSSISTVMVVGLVNAGLMDLAQAVGVILGANIGTTITGWILAIKVGKYGLLFLGLGIFPFLFSKRSDFKSTGQLLVALGLVFLGLETMSGSFKPLRSHEGFLAYLSLFDPYTTSGLLGCVAMGCLLTFVIQSSSAMLGITIALATTGTLSFPTAVALVLGENIGTTITAFLASFGANLSAKRAAYSHAIFNICGVTLMIFLFTPFVGIVDSLVPGMPDLVGADGEKPNIAAHIAMAHSLFNVTAVLLILPFLRTFVRFVERLVPGTTETEAHHLQYLGTPGQLTAEVALTMAESELFETANRVKLSFGLCESFLKSKGDDDALFKRIVDIEDFTDMAQKEITTFVCQTMEGSLTNEQSAKAYSLIRAADELESIADYLVSVCRYRQRLFQNGQNFSDAGWGDALEFLGRATRLYEMAFEVTTEYNEANAERAKYFAGTLNAYADELRERHLARMKDGTCQPLAALIYSDLIVALRRVKNHSVNLYEAALYAKSPDEANQLQSGIR